MDRSAKAEGANNVHAQASVCVVQVCTFASLTLPHESRTQCFRLLGYETFSSFDCSLRERSIEYILADFVLGICEKAKTGSIFTKALIQSGFFVPTILVVVDVIVGIGIGKVELHGSCQRTWQWSRNGKSVASLPRLGQYGLHHLCGT